MFLLLLLLMQIPEIPHEPSGVKDYYWLKARLGARLLSYDFMKPSESHALISFEFHFLVLHQIRFIPSALSFCGSALPSICAVYITYRDTTDDLYSHLL